MTTIQELIADGTIDDSPKLLVIPDYAKESAMKKIRDFLADKPHTEDDVEHLWQEILAYYGTFGRFPDFEIQENPTP